MKKEEITHIISKLQRLMLGYNYQITFGVDFFENCSTLESFKTKLKETHEDSQPDAKIPVPVTTEEFWIEIDSCLKYRGDSASGLQLSPRQELKLAEEQEKYKSIINDYINQNTKIYYYADEQGIPGYPVWWDFRFIVFVDDGNCLFIYGSASD